MKCVLSYWLAPLQNILYVHRVFDGNDTSPIDISQKALHVFYTTQKDIQGFAESLEFNEVARE